MAKIALLIGVSNYTSGFTPLPSAIRDVQAMKRVLEHPDIGSFDRVQSLENPDRQSMEDAIENLFTNCRKDDLVLLFFSGHGVKDDDARLYLAALNARKDERGRLVKSRAVAADLVHQFMENCKSKRQVIVLDCCFSGAFAEGMKAKDDGSVDVRNQLGGEGRVVLTSSTSIQYSFEQQDSDLSIYTRYLVEGMETGDADQDRDGAIGVNELHEYAKRRVREIKPEMNPEMYLAKEGYKILLAQTPSTHPESRYAHEVRQLAHNWEIRFKEPNVLDRLHDWLNLPPQNDVQMSSTRRKALDALYQRLALSQAVASRIEAEVLQPYREFHKKFTAYKQEFFSKIVWGKQITDSDRRELKALQCASGLSNEIVAYAEQQVLRQMQRFPYSALRSFYRLLNLKTFILLFISLAIVLIGIEIFKAVQVGFQTRQQSPLSSTETISLPSSNATSEAQQQFQEASKKLDEKRYKEAIELYKVAIQANPQIADYYAGIGFAYYKLAEQTANSDNAFRNENFKLAIENLKKAIDFQTTIYPASNAQMYSKYKIYIFLGYAYYDLDQNQNASKAFDAFNSAIQEEPPQAWMAVAYEGRAKARIVQAWAGDTIGARKDYEEARRLYVETNVGGKNFEAIKRVNDELSKIQ